MNKKISIIKIVSITVISFLGVFLALYCAKVDFSNIQTEINLTWPYIFVIVFFITIFTSYILYILMSRKNKKFYTSKDKMIIYILSNIVIITLLTLTITTLTNNYLSNINKTGNEKDQVTLNKKNKVEPGEIDLSTQKTDVTITTSGTYTFSGNFNNSIIIDAASVDDVIIVLNNVTIETENTATIIGLSAKSITIELKEGSENTLSDGGNSEYDGCIFSNAELILQGTGKLTVNGNQNEGEGIATEAKNITINDGTYVITSNDDGINAGGDGATITINGGTFYINSSGDGIDSNKDAIINGGTIFVIGSDIGGDSGIDTDEGYVINGGTVIALGTDMIETPTSQSKQKTIAFTLNDKIEKDTIVTLMKGEETVVSFKAPKSFKTIIISADTLTEDSYSLYENGTNTAPEEYGIYKDGTYTRGDKLTINNEDTFKISQTVNLFGNR